MEGFDVSIMVTRVGFRSKDVSVNYHVAECKNEQCKGHSSASFAQSGLDFANISGEIIFLANVCV